MPAHVTPAATGTRSGLQERLESSRIGRRLIGAFLVATVGAIVVSNLPAGAVQRRLNPVAQPYLVATGLDQRWNMFAPLPRNEILYLEARVEHADGRVTVWRPPTGDPLLGSYRDAHWRKFAEHAVVRPGNPDGWPQLWRPLALYAAAQKSDDLSPAVSVTLVKRSAFILQPGNGEPDHTPFREEAYYTLRLR